MWEVLVPVDGQFLNLIMEVANKGKSIIIFDIWKITMAKVLMWESLILLQVDSKFRGAVQFAYVFDPNHDILTQTDAPGLLFLTPGAVSETMKKKFDAPFHIMVPFFEHTVAKTAKKWCHKHVTAYFLLGIGHIHLKKVTDSLEMNVIRSSSKD